MTTLTSHSIARIPSDRVLFWLAASLASVLFTSTSVRGQFFVSPGATTGTRNAFRIALGGSYSSQDFDGYNHGFSIPNFTAGSTLVHVKLLDSSGAYRYNHGYSFQSSYFSTPGIFYSRGLMNGWYFPGFHPRMEFSFCPPVQGFGLWVFDDGADDRFKMSVVEVGGQSLVSPFLYRAGTNIQLEGFLGYVSQVGVERVVIEHESPSGGPPRSRSFQVDYAEVGPSMFAASSYTYGGGYGVSGTPTLGLSASPSLGTTVDLGIANPSSLPTVGLLALGFVPAFNASPTLGITLWLVPSSAMVMPIGASGGNLPLTIPNDPTLRGLCVFLQAFEWDSGAWAYSPGLKLVLD